MADPHECVFKANHPGGLYVSAAFFESFKKAPPRPGLWPSAAGWRPGIVILLPRLVLAQNLYRTLEWPEETLRGGSVTERGPR